MALDSEDREDLDQVLAFIGSESLSDEEFEAIDLDDLHDELLNYAALLNILTLRESISSMRKRLEYYYLAQGVEVSNALVGTSNVLIGGGVCG